VVSLLILVRLSIDHNKLGLTLCSRNCLIALCHCVLLKSWLTAWYGTLYATYGGIIRYVAIKLLCMCGVRLQGLCFIVIFVQQLVHVDDLIMHRTRIKWSVVQLETYLFCCVMYADDLILLSASLFCGLQSMLDICYSFDLSHFMIFNSKKSLCCMVGSVQLKITHMKMGDKFIEWVNAFKYLYRCYIQFSYILAQVFMLSVTSSRGNSTQRVSIFCHSRRNTELVKVQVKSFVIYIVYIKNDRFKCQ